VALLLSFLSLIGLAFVAVLVGDGVRVLLARRRKEAAARPLTLVVTARSEVAGNLVRLTLARTNGGRLPAFAAGQHLTLRVPAGAGGSTAQRAYSLAAWSATPRSYELGIKREERGLEFGLVSGWVWQHLQIGSPVTALPPKGDFVLDRTIFGALVLIGGGIGITPMRAMLQETLVRTPRRPVILFHGARSASGLLYREAFETLAENTPHFRYHPRVSRPDSAWAQPCARIDSVDALAALADAGIDVAAADFYLCAGRALMEALRAGFATAGIDLARVHWEAFGVAATAGESGQQVCVIKDGRATEIVTAGEPTLLATLEAHQLAPASDCRAGTCGECRMRLLDGQVRWLAEPGLALAEDEFLPCVCAAAGNLSVAVS
jgi:ferredoxin-NADP reductase